MTAPWKGVWPEWVCEKRIGQGSCGTVYQAVRGKGEAAERAAVKVIHIPQSEAETEMLRSEGMTEEESREYFDAVVEDLLSEVSLSSGLSDHRNVVRVEDYAVEPRRDGLGATIFIRMELLTPLSVYLSDKTLPEDDVIRLGRDICRALICCHKAGILHRDVKPENIFVDKEGNFKLGDFGIARRIEHASTCLTRVGTPFYAAPEVALSSQYDGRADIYSLGLVLYRLLNHNRLPFMEGKRLLTPADRNMAMERRRSGESLPAPLEASERLADVIRKACAFKPEDRYQTAEEFYEALSGEEKKRALPLWRRKGIAAAALAVIVLGIAGFGWQRGWFARIQRPETTPVREEIPEATEPLAGSSAEGTVIPAEISAANGMTADPTGDTLIPQTSEQPAITSFRASRTFHVSEALTEDPTETASVPGSEILTSADETEPSTVPPVETDIPTTIPDPATTTPDPTTTALPVATMPKTAAPTTTTAPPATTAHVHKWGEWQTEYYGEPCESGGVRTRVCSKCGTEEREEFDAAGHQWSDWVKEYWGDPCLDSPVLVRTCSVCGIQEESEEYLPPEGHSIEEGVCTRCGKEEFLFQLNYEKTAYTVFALHPDDFRFSLADDIVVPSYYKGVPVTEVHLDFDEGGIDCGSLTLPATAKTVSVFNARMTGTLTVPSGVENLSLSAVGAGSIVLGEGIKHIEGGYFPFSLGNGGTLTVPDSVESFNLNINGNVVLGTGVKNADNCIINGNLAVKEGNPVFRAQGNCLIRKEDKAIMNNGLDPVIPSDGTVKKIRKMHIATNGDWKDLMIPEGIEEIADRCFDDGYLVLHLPASLKCFSNMNSSAQYYHYAGTVEELKELPLTEGYNSFIVICSNGRVKSVPGEDEAHPVVFVPAD